ncbi:hypothetical protein ACFQMA_00520 [Halosimplex aquaticum]|uniref:DNA replication factor GINS n=1 Tax=Halosimplex aquaticum TaxID=3026162 RepID=A0ABD5XYP8_9EURY|nr:hypothetical protein [Halosimplex aquaticum]
MDLDELRSVQSRERQTDSLQQLRESFYQDAGEFIQQLHRERERAADEADDPWNAPEVTRLSDDIDTAEQTVEAIYERRVGKIVKMASLAAADMPTEDEGLTAEEQTLFDTLVDAIERNRANVEAVIDGEDPVAAVADAVESSETPVGAGPNSESPDSAASEPDPADGTTDRPTADGETRPTPPDSPADLDADGSAAETGVDAADLMGGDGPDESQSEADAGDDATTDSPAAPAEPGGDRPAPPDEPTGDANPSAGGSEDPTAAEDADEGGAADVPSVDRTTVRITADVGEIFGVDQRAYDLSTDDVVQLPEANAGPLVERDAAERLD